MPLGRALDWSDVVTSTLASLGTALFMKRDDKGVQTFNTEILQKLKISATGGNLNDEANFESRWAPLDENEQLNIVELLRQLEPKNRGVFILVNSLIPDDAKATAALRAFSKLEVDHFNNAVEAMRLNHRDNNVKKFIDKVQDILSKENLKKVDKQVLKGLKHVEVESRNFNNRTKGWWDKLAGKR